MLMPPRSFNSARCADDDAVADRQLVAIREIDTVMDFYAVAHVLKDVAAKHTAEAQSQPVIQSDRRAVEHLPEPQQRFALRVALAVDVGKMLRLQRHVHADRAKA